MLVPLIRECLNRGKQKLPRPSDLVGLHELVNSQTPEQKCTCDICDPDFYASFWHCPILPHFHIKLEKDVEKNEFGNECYLPLKSSSTVTRCESMHLARKTIDYFDRPKEELNGVQLHALRELAKWRDTRINDILGVTQSRNRAALLPEKEMRFLWKCINELFFGRDSSCNFFRWKSHLGHDSVGLAVGHPPLHFIKMESSTEDGEKPWGGSLILETLGTLLHEAVHVYFHHHACYFCWSAEWNKNANGHGNAWQLLTARVEECFLRFLKLPVDLGRFLCIRVHWDHFYPLPSKHDLEEWKLGNEKLNESYCHDLVKKYQKAVEPEKFRIEEIYNQWWADGPRTYFILDDKEEEKKVWVVENGLVIRCRLGDCVSADSEADGAEAAQQCVIDVAHPAQQCEIDVTHPVLLRKA